ncbi:hypothetical protein [Labrenzia sp. DG1229]|uniref:hypothetical protein n=1 Tax=Labrenzia sp. DG1229 TaxID=681847 RepID=UPI00048EFFD9|nr:hypothetical protein [Labrenzia sp. DG1229]
MTGDSYQHVPADNLPIWTDELEASGEPDRIVALARKAASESAVRDSRFGFCGIKPPPMHELVDVEDLPIKVSRSIAECDDLFLLDERCRVYVWPPRSISALVRMSWMLARSMPLNSPDASSLMRPLATVQTLSSVTSSPASITVRIARCVVVLIAALLITLFRYASLIPGAGRGIFGISLSKTQKTEPSRESADERKQGSGEGLS